MQHSTDKESTPATVSPSTDSAPADLDDALARAGLSPADLSHELRCSREAVFNWRRRRAIPRGDHLCRMAELLGLAPAVVLALITPEEISP